jgi:ATP-dependent Clp protease ATP-binding subunit ClpB
LGALKKEKNPLSAQKREDLEKLLAEKQKESERLSNIWKEEKEKLLKSKETKSKLEKLRYDLEKAEREGKYEEAGRLKYDLIPNLESLLPPDENEESNSLLSEAVTSRHISYVVSKITGILFTILMSQIFHFQNWKLENKINCCKWRKLCKKLLLDKMKQ